MIRELHPPRPPWRRRLRAVLFAAAPVLLGGGAAHAETLPGALARAYAGNPGLNAERAGLRVTDENVPRALSGYRPSVAATANLGVSSFSGRLGEVGLEGRTRGTLLSRDLGLQVSQNLFNGFRTANATRQAESEVLGGRETLRQAEGDTLFSGAQAYMNVLRDTATLDLQRNNVEVLEEQLRQTRLRFEQGQITPTDVSQAEARLAFARSQVSNAESALQASIATYRRVIGVEPRQLAPGRPPDQLVPATLTAAVQVALTEHPAIVAALHAVDAAELQVKVVEGELAPSLNVVGRAGQAYDAEIRGDRAFTASLLGQLSIPIYEGGEVYARARQEKERAGQRRILAESVRDQIREAVVTSWGALEAAKANVRSAQVQITSSETALRGVREEARAGQRTTLEVLNQQQELLNARVNLIVAQRDRVVAAYAVAQSIGRLNVDTLGLRAQRYRAKEHFDQVKDLPWGLRTPDGR